MKKILFTFFLLFLGFFLKSQLIDPLKWSAQIEKLDKENLYEISLKISLEKSWHVYSIQHKGELGIPTTIEIKDQTNFYKKQGKTQEIGKLEDIILFGQRSLVFSDEVIYKQKIEALTKENFKGKIKIEIQACNDTMCLPPSEKEFVFEIAPKKISIKEALEDGLEEEKNDQKPSTVSKPKKTLKENENISAEKNQSSLYSIFLLGLIGGLAAVFMPCIFPMIPITIGYFTKQKSRGKQKALFYGFSIVAIYVVLGIFITLLFGASALNEFSTNPWVNLIFFFLFILFAISFFGAFELTLPSSWANRADKKANKGGFVGIFFMAFVLSLVSFSCTGPIIGTLLVEAASKGSLIGPSIGMLGFSFGLAFPFVFLALFPGLLKLLPKSGGWLGVIKISFGFIELALAMKFLSNADLVWQAHLLERELFLAFWIVIFSLLGLYLLNMLKLNSSQKSEEKIGILRIFSAVFSLGFAIYMLPGLWGAPLKILSGFIPPQTYSELNQANAFINQTSQSLEKNIGIEGMKKGPQGIGVFHDYAQGLDYAKKQKKPILLDFTGFACANCRKMEEYVWSESEVKNFLSNEVVVISLHVDDRKALKETYFSKILKKKIKKVGQKWTEFQIKHFMANAQPFYVIVDYKLNKMNEPIGVEFDKENYLSWLKKGKEKFYKLNP